MAPQNAPLAALALGLGSYCLLLLVSQEAPLKSLALMGVMAVFTVAISLVILWDIVRLPGGTRPAPEPETPVSEDVNNSNGLKISNE